MNAPDNAQNHIVSEVIGPLAVISLNRPKSLNALTLEMIRQISGLLMKWESNEDIKAVLFRGMGNKAFSSGGDLKAFYKSGMKFRRGEVSIDIPAMYFEAEYAMNKRIFHFPKPTISFMNGITMGGGYGVAGNCRYRIVNDMTRFAMPEVGIGFFPDVGSLYHFMRCPYQIGRFLATTGVTLEAPDMIFAQLADFYIEYQDVEDFIEALSSDMADGQTVEQCLKSDFPILDTGFLRANAEDIEYVFSDLEYENILSRLEKVEDLEFRSETLAALTQKSPLSIHVTLEYLKRAENQIFDDIIEMDSVLATRFLEHRDLYEGIRAAIIEKDYIPIWDPGTAKDVTREDIEAFFKPINKGTDIEGVDIDFLDAEEEGAA